MAELRFHPQVKRDTKRFAPSLISQLREVHFPALRDNPSVGQPLKAALKGVLSYHFHHHQTEYRIAYQLDPAKDIVTVLMIRPRENFYQSLRRRLS